MCGRYVSVARLQELQEHYRATGAGDGTELAPSHNVAPTSKVYAVLERGRTDGAGARRQVRAVRWGLVPAWWKPGAGRRQAAVLARVSVISESTTCSRPPLADTARCRDAELPRARADSVSSVMSSQSPTDSSAGRCSASSRLMSW